MNVGMFAPYVCMYVGSIVTTYREVLLFHFPSYVSISVLLATAPSGDRKACRGAEYICTKYAKLVKTIKKINGFYGLSRCIFCVFIVMKFI